MEKKFRWKKFLIYLSSCLLVIISFFAIHYYEMISDYNKPLEIIITINGISSAILTTFLFGRLNISKELKKDAKSNGIILSQSITNLRRIFHELTNYFEIWQNDKSTKHLLDAGEFSKIEYFDYKLMSYSDHEPIDKDLIEKLQAHADYKQSETGLYLGMISIANDRKAINQDYSILENNYNDGELIYDLKFIRKILKIEHLSRISDNLKRYPVINYNRLNNESQERIKNLLLKINPNYNLVLSSTHLNILIQACNDIEADILPKLLKVRLILNKKLSSIELKIIGIIKISLIIGVLMPLISMTIINNEFLKILFCEGLLTLNFYMLLYFVLNIKKFSKQQL